MKNIIQKLFGTTKQAIISTACIMAVIALVGAGTAYAAAKNTAGDKTSQVFESAETTSTASDAGTASATTTTTGDTSATTDTTTTGTSSASGTSATGSTASAQITLDAAKEIALADAGVSSSDATFKKEKQDYEDRVLVYDLEFYTSTGEYEYEIRVSDGTIVSKSVKEYVASSGSGTTSDAYISVDEAKEIALNKAGLSSADVTFKKAKLDRDDGIMVYELEFYCGKTEYEVEINASTGEITEYEVDMD